MIELAHGEQSFLLCQAGSSDSQEAPPPSIHNPEKHLFASVLAQNAQNQWATVH
jgi:hypothetical protein